MYLLEKLNVPETTPWRGYWKFPSTNEMLEDVVNNRNSCSQNIQKHQIKLHKLKVELVFNSNRGKDEKKR